jgi:hypothetical protein
MVANQLDVDGTGTNNTVQTVFGTNVPGGTVVYAYAGGVFNTVSYASKTATWGATSNDVKAALQPGKGVFVKSTASTVTLVGNVMQGTLNTPYTTGFNIVGSQVPQAGLVQTDLGYTPLGGDTVYQFPANQGPYIINSFAAKTSTWTPSQPNIGVGESFWIKVGAPGTWTRNFTVGP